ncbi:MAG: acyl-CoA thioesterase [Leptolyngbyaceae cyanobacterium]
MPFSYERTVRFRDTDAAGVVYFANVLSMCHEAYEASLQAAGIDLRQFFSDRHRAIPITHADVDFLQPMFCGKTYRITLTPQLVQPSKFLIAYHLTEWESSKLTSQEKQPQAKQSQTPMERVIARANTHHVCIDPSQRTRQPLSKPIHHWLEQFQESAQDSGQITD